MKDTNLDKEKEIFKQLLHLEPISKNSIFVDHPFLNTIFVQNENNEIVNVFEKIQYFQHYVKTMSEMLDEANSLSRLFIHVQKTYKMTAFNQVQNYLNEKDFARILKD